MLPLVMARNPWDLFDQAWTKVVGYPTADFTVVPGVTPMATFKETATIITIYYSVVFGGRELMRSRPAFKLNSLFIIHNLYLTAISGVLLGLILQQVVPSLWHHGLFQNVCGAAGWSQKLLVLYYLNYLTKYLELLDTVFLVLKKKPLTFLHTYHHGATALLCYHQLIGETAVSWVPITLNLTVHVLMYWYYFQAARGVRVWWKQYITILQITQFVLDLAAVYFASYTHFVHRYAPQLPHVGRCGEDTQEFAAAMGCGILSSYLVLFIMFYFSTYKNPSAKKALRRASRAELPTISEGKDMTINAMSTVKTALTDSVKDEKCAPR